MKNTIDIHDFVEVPTVDFVQKSMVERFKKRRKESKLSQRAISNRSGVSYASIRRFESSGEISLTSLLKLSAVIGGLDDFNLLFKNPVILNLKDVK